MTSWVPWFPYAVAFIGVIQSLSARVEEVDVVVADGHVVEGVQRHRIGDVRSERLPDLRLLCQRFKYEIAPALA
jgi:hypothetical protein